MNASNVVPIDTNSDDDKAATSAAGTTRRKGRASKQDWRTPPDVLAAIKERFGAIAIDLACDASNSVAPKGLDFPRVNSLEIAWSELYPNEVMFLNCPFDDIESWAEKCATEASKIAELGGEGKIILLTPASVASNWFVDYVYGSALVLPLAPRLTFLESDGTPAKDPYPKDCMLSVFGEPPGFEPWRYRPEVPREPRTRAVARCKLPPPGWWCKRRPGHNGPCAALPITASEPLPGVV